MKEMPATFRNLTLALMVGAMMVGPAHAGSGDAVNFYLNGTQMTATDTPCLPQLGLYAGQVITEAQWKQLNVCETSLLETISKRFEPPPLRRMARHGHEQA